MEVNENQLACNARQLLGQIQDNQAFRGARPNNRVGWLFIKKDANYYVYGWGNTTRYISPINDLDEDIEPVFDREITKNEWVQTILTKEEATLYWPNHKTCPTCGVLT